MCLFSNDYSYLNMAIGGGVRAMTRTTVAVAVTLVVFVVVVAVMCVVVPSMVEMVADVVVVVVVVAMAMWVPIGGRGVGTYSFMNKNIIIYEKVCVYL